MARRVRLSLAHGSASLAAATVLTQTRHEAPGFNQVGTLPGGPSEGRQLGGASSTA